MPVTILAGIQIVYGLLLGLVFISVVADPATAGPILTSLTEIRTWPLEVQAAALAVTLGTLALLQLLAGVLLLRLRRWGWTLTMLLAGFSLATQILNWWSTGEIVEVSMAFGVLTVLYLNQRQVREAFGLAGERGVDLRGERG